MVRRAILRWDPRVRRGRRLLKATTSPTGLITGCAVSVAGLALGIGAPWLVGAGVAAWLTSVVLHLRDPKLLGAMLAPEFDRDLSALDDQHLPAMVAALSARDRFEAAVADMPDRQDFAGMKARVTEVLHRLYDSVVWTQRADGFLTSVDEPSLARRLHDLPPSSPLAAELAEQAAEIEGVRQRRKETAARITAGITGIETLALKMGSLALGAADSPIETMPAAEVRALREELDAYADGLEEIEQDLRRALPPTPA
ncbi:MAG: hypothetical protein P1T08_06345 [Acidimicrobiia bacterium]|nr:hypothetical protein [Acidimicrobiia bacterium]